MKFSLDDIKGVTIYKRTYTYYKNIFTQEVTNRGPTLFIYDHTIFISEIRLEILPYQYRPRSSQSKINFFTLHKIVTNRGPTLFIYDHAIFLSEMRLVILPYEFCCRSSQSKVYSLTCYNAS